MERWFPWGLAALVLGGCGCEQTKAESAPTPPSDDSFANPEPVVIEGYDGHAMEPFITRDGTRLFFNNLNAATDSGQPNDTNIHVARHLSGGTRFEYLGPVSGASTDLDPARNELEGVPSLDADGRLYFTSTVHYAVGALATLFVGQLDGTSLGPLTAIGPLKNDLSEAVPGDVDMDAEIAPDGQHLVFTESFFSGGPVPDRADLGTAVRQSDGSFAVAAGSADTMHDVNTADLEYAPASSADGRELYFTRWVRSGSGTFLVLVSRRTSPDEAWGPPKRVDAIAGEYTEGPSLSGDGRALYYHQLVEGRYRIYRVTRSP